MIPIQSVTVSHDDLLKAEMEYETIKSERDGLDRQLAEMTLLRNQALTERNAAQAAEQSAKGELTRANAALAESVVLVQKLTDELAKRPLPTLPTLPGKITRTTLPRIAGFTIAKDKSSPTATLYSQVKTAMRWGQSMGLNYWRGFFNATEVAQHIGLKASTLGNLPEYGRSLGLGFIADTIDNAGVQALDDTTFNMYIDGLLKMGAEGVYFNDADRLPIDTLKSMVARVRSASQETPIFASLMGSANIDLYKNLADDRGIKYDIHVEIQTFGTTGELTNFLKKDVIMCLDLRKPLTVTDLKARADIALSNPPRQFFLYADLPTDYDAMPDDEDAVIRAWVSAWKKLS
jgi:hypothetical protein